MGDLVVQKAPQRAFTRMILEDLSILSTERRQKYYIIIYCWEIFQGFAPNYGLPVDSPDGSIRGRSWLFLNCLDISIRIIMENLPDRSIFNSFHLYLRNVDSSLDSFERNLDSYQSSIPN